LKGFKSAADGRENGRDGRVDGSAVDYVNYNYRSGGHQVIDPPVLPDAGKRRVHLPSWNLHHSLGSLVVGVCFDIGQPFPLSSP
jgi:hypothetical protein